MQYSTVQYSAVQYSAEQYSTVEVLMLLEPRHVPRLQQRRHAQPLRRARERQLAVADNVASLQSRYYNLRLLLVVISVVI